MIAIHLSVPVPPGGRKSFDQVATAERLGLDTADAVEIIESEEDEPPLGRPVILVPDLPGNVYSWKHVGPYSAGSDEICPAVNLRRTGIATRHETGVLSYKSSGFIPLV
jgi:hypothetical protein